MSERITDQEVEVKLHRKSDIGHEATCNSLHHAHERRITVLEVESKNTKETVHSAIADLLERQEIHEERYERMLERLTSALVGIELKMEKFMSQTSASNQTNEKYLKYGIPIVIAVVTGLYFYFTHLPPQP